MKTIAWLLAGALTCGAGAQAAPLELTAWLVHWDGGASIRDFEAHADLISRVGAGWYACGADGLPMRLPDSEVLPQDKAKILSLGKLHGVKVFALASNFNPKKGDFDADLVSLFLEKPALMKRHAKALAEMAKADGADGLDMDYEGLKAADKDALSEFMEVLSGECHKRGLILAMALHPKTAEPGSWDGDRAQDWARLGKAVDLFRPMAYDNHWATSDAGPIAPPEWTAQVLAHACALVDKRKIEMGIPAYGYDWLGKTSTGIGWPDFQKLVLQQGIQPRRDPSSAELTFKYGQREVWFADAKAEEAKFGQAKKAGVRGLALWHAGAEDPAFWDEFRKLR
jgi:spore germination protein